MLFIWPLQLVWKHLVIFIVIVFNVDLQPHNADFSYGRDLGYIAYFEVKYVDSLLFV